MVLKLQKVDKKCLESFQMCWRKMEKIMWADLAKKKKNEEVLNRGK
jgi:hypothetical protein